MQLLGKLKELAEMPVEQASPLASEGSSSMLRERSGTSSPGVKGSVGSSDSLISRDRSGTSSYIFRSVGAADQSVLPRERSGTATNSPTITPKSSVGAVNAPLVVHKTSSNLAIDSARGSGSGSKIAHNGSKISNAVSPRGSVGAANPPSPAGKRE